MSFTTAPLSLADIPDLIRLTRMQVEETIPHMPFDPAVVEHYARWVATSPDPDVRIWLAREEGRAVGFLVGVRSAYLFCHGHSVNQEVLFVVPDRRGSRLAYRLMRELDTWAAETGALEVYAGVANGFNPARTAAFMEKALGFQKVGSYLRKITR